MKAVFNRGLLAAAFGVASSVVPGKTPSPILQNVKLQIKGGKATLIATDSEIGIRHDVPDVSPDGNGEALLPARRVGDILKELRDEKVTIHIDAKSVRIVGDRSDFRLPVADAAEFPPVAGFDDAAYFSIPGKALREMIRRTVFSTDPANGRYALGGVLFEFLVNRLQLVATDSRRLAVVFAPLGSVGSAEIPAVPPVIPAKALGLLEKTIPDTDDPVHIAVHHPNHVLFRSANATIFTRLVEGRFPRYADVIPKGHNVAVDFPAGALLSVIRQSMIVTNEESRGVDFEFKPGQMTLVSQAADVGESRVDLPISYAKDDLTLRFDPRFIADFLKALPGETLVSLKLTTDEDPGVLTTDDGYTYVIMPLNRET